MDIHRLVNERNIVGAYALLPNKRRETYVTLLLQVKRLTHDASPTSVMIDFEASMISALREVHPHSTINGCIFHLSQSIFRQVPIKIIQTDSIILLHLTNNGIIFRHVQMSGLQSLYNQDTEFRRNIRMIAAISFVPVMDVPLAFQALSDHCSDAEQTILDYFESNYIG